MMLAGNGCTTMQRLPLSTRAPIHEHTIHLTWRGWQTWNKRFVTMQLQWRESRNGNSYLMPAACHALRESGERLLPFLHPLPRRVIRFEGCNSFMVKDVEWEWLARWWRWWWWRWWWCHDDVMMMMTAWWWCHDDDVMMMMSWWWWWPQVTSHAPLP